MCMIRCFLVCNPIGLALLLQGYCVILKQERGKKREIPGMAYLGFGFLLGGETA